MPHQRRRTRLLDYTRIVMVALGFLGLGYVLSLDSVKQYFDIAHLKAMVNQGGAQIALTVVAIFALVTSVGFPRLWACVIIGGLYGAVAGAALAQVSTIIGALLNFYIARLFLRGPVTRQLRGRMLRWYHHISENDFRWILYFRLFPLSNSTLTNCISGASRARVSAFLAATFIGYLPLTIAFALFGSSAVKQNGWQTLVGVAMLGVLFAGRSLYKRLAPETMTDEAEEDAEEAASLTANSALRGDAQVPTAVDPPCP